MEPKALSILVKEYLSLPGETFAKFRDEWQKLTEKDKEDLHQEFEKMGIPVKPQ